MEVLLLPLLQDLLPLPRLEELLYLLHPVNNKYDKTHWLWTSNPFILILPRISSGFIGQLMFGITITGSSP